MFITLEGIDRAGKSTQAGLLAEALGPRTILIREPGGTEAGERIRRLLMDEELELDPRAELLLFCAARAELVARVIRPALADGADVVCDRFIDSTVAYQGAARGLGTGSVEAVNAVAVGGCLPDLTILLRIDPQTALVRGQQRLRQGATDGADRFEAEGPDFQRSIALAYEEIARRNGERVAVVDAVGSRQEVHEAVMAAVAARRQ